VLAVYDYSTGDARGAYILRTLKTADFEYNAARDKLLGLQIQSSGKETMLYTSVADESADAYAGDREGQQGSMQASLMRLGTSLNLESRLTVSQRRTLVS
jgi:DNA mismatch repair protein MSH5